MERPAYLFLSHFHLDHVAGLHLLAKFSFRQGLTICGPAGVRGVIERLVNAPFTIPLTGLSFDTRFVELPADGGALPFGVKSLPLVHASPCLGFRLALDDKVIAYCTDTGYCANAVELAREADLLISECALKSGEESPEWPHLNPETAARIAHEAGAKRLALVHFDAHVYGSLADRDKAAAMAALRFPHVIAARDEMTLEV
jgi:ribonuclease BN (tRNA processing enzyme)